MPLGDGWEPRGGGMSNPGTPPLLSTGKRKQTALEQGVFFPLKGHQDSKLLFVYRNGGTEAEG